MKKLMIAAGFGLMFTMLSVMPAKAESPRNDNRYGYESHDRRDDGFRDRDHRDAGFHDRDRGFRREPVRYERGYDKGCRPAYRCR